MALFTTMIIAAATTLMASASQEPADRAYTSLANLVGTTWRGDIKGPNGNVTVETKFEWGPNKKVVRALSVIGTNLPTQSESEALYTWLPNEKKLLYMDMHGEPSAYMGYGKMQGDDILIEFKSMDQKDAEYRVVIKFPKPDVMTTEISAKKDGHWVLLIGYDRNKVKSEAK